MGKFLLKKKKTRCGRVCVHFVLHIHSMRMSMRNVNVIIEYHTLCIKLIRLPNYDKQNNEKTTISSQTFRFLCVVAFVFAVFLCSAKSRAWLFVSTYFSLDFADFIYIIYLFKNMDYVKWIKLLVSTCVQITHTHTYDWKSQFKTYKKNVVIMKWMGMHCWRFVRND